MDVDVSHNVNFRLGRTQKWTYLDNIPWFFCELKCIMDCALLTLVPLPFPSADVLPGLKQKLANEISHRELPS